MCDCLILSTPTFFKGPSAQCKELVDRFYAFLDEDNNCILERGKKAIIVTSGPDYPSATTVSDLLFEVCSELGFDVIKEIICADYDDLANSKDLCDYAYSVGRDLSFLKV